MSANRRFDPISVPAEAGRRRVHRFVCSDCKAVWDVSANTFGGSRAIEDLQRQAKRCGWQLGRNAEHDVCGACAKARRGRGRGAHLELIPALKDFLVSLSKRHGLWKVAFDSARNEFEALQSEMRSAGDRIAEIERRLKAAGVAK